MKFLRRWRKREDASPNFAEQYHDQLEPHRDEILGILTGITVETGDDPGGVVVMLRASADELTASRLRRKLPTTFRGGPVVVTTFSGFIVDHSD